MRPVDILLISSLERNKQVRLAQEIENRSKHIVEVTINALEHEMNYDLIISDTVIHGLNVTFFWEIYPMSSDWERLKKIIAMINNEKN